MIGLTVLGATGSIGASTLEVAALHPDRFAVRALTASTQWQRLAELCSRHRPKYAVLMDVDAAEQLRSRLADAGLGTEVLCGSEGLCRAATLEDVECVMAAIVGAAGLDATLAAARAGKRVLLANKEALVMAGPLFMHSVQRSGATLLPVDSEHNAVFQCMPEGYRTGDAAPGVEQIMLTASGGPFREWPLARLDSASPEQAVAHPNWVMGRKISVDSATMMNKGLEVIEACLLFGVEPAAVKVVIHPQSVIHSLVRYRDGSVLAQLGQPDMRTPIAHALAWPERIDSGVEPLDLIETGKLEFEAPDPRRYPCLELAYQAAAAGGTAPAHLNAANEVAVAAFLRGKARFTDIAVAVEQVLQALPPEPAEDLETIRAADRRARELAARAVVSKRRGAR